MSDFRAEIFSLDRIVVQRESRQRREIKVDEGLKASIARNGVLQPIIVSDDFVLIAGERRLAACKALDAEGRPRLDGFGFIPVRFLSDLSPSERELIELEENVKRLDLSWPDLVRSVGRLHKLQKSLDLVWTAEDTASFCSLTPPTISMYLKVFESLEDPRVLSSGTVREAYNLLIKRKSRANDDALEEMIEATKATGPLAAGPDELDLLLAGEPQKEEPSAPEGGLLNFLLSTEPASETSEQTLTPEPSILREDFLSWAPQYSGKRFNLIHCDFPYGVGLFSSNGIRSGDQRSQMGRDEGESYDDSRGAYEALVEGLCEHFDRLMAVSGHLMFWLDARSASIEWTKAAFAAKAPRVQWTRFPLLWLKSDNVGIAAIPDREPRHIYEVCLLGSVGERKILRPKSDAYAAPTDKALHPSAKPEAMLRFFMEMLVDENTSLLDPTCGSGSALRAAESLGAKRVLGLETNEGFALGAERALARERAKYKAAAALGI